MMILLHMCCYRVAFLSLQKKTFLCMRSRLGSIIESVYHINASHESSNFYINSFFQPFWCVFAFLKLILFSKAFFETTLWKAWRRRNHITSWRVFKWCREAPLLLIWTRIWQKACKDNSVGCSALRCEVNFLTTFTKKAPQPKKFPSEVLCRYHWRKFPFRTSWFLALSTVSKVAFHKLFWPKFF